MLSDPFFISHTDLSLSAINHFQIFKSLPDDDTTKNKPMPKNIIDNIGKKIRRIRGEQALTMQEVADGAGVSKGLISRIENMRTVPSLPVLINIILALNTEISDFFSDIEGMNGSKVFIQRKEDLKGFTKEDAKGFRYFDIINQPIGDLVMQATLLELEPGSHRKQLVTNGFEFKYILEGEVEYKIESESYFLKKGDSLFFDARLPHVPINNGEEKAVLLVIYFLKISS